MPVNYTKMGHTKEEILLVLLSRQQAWVAAKDIKSYQRNHHRDRAAVFNALVHIKLLEVENTEVKSVERRYRLTDIGRQVATIIKIRKVSDETGFE